MKYESKIRNQTEIETGSNEARFSNPGIGIRHLHSLLLALCVFCGYLQRVNLSVTIVAMTKLHRTTGQKEIDGGFPVYDWDNEVRGYLLSSFFIGYFIMNFPAAYLGVYFNVKILLSTTFVINGILSCVTPSLINFTYDGSNEFLLHAKELAGIGNWRALAVLRAVQGMLQAFMLPTIHAISAKWVPPNERSRLIGFIFSGMPFGTTVALAGSGLLASHPSLGWPSVFYVSGAAGLLWVFFWIRFGSSSPSTHATISSNEYSYICSNLPPENDKSEKQVPWLDILTSIHVWAIIIAHATHSWGFWLLITEMPTYLNAVLGFNIKLDGLLSAAPYAGSWLLQFPVMWIADKLNEKRITSITTSRKIWTTIGQGGGAIGLVALGYLDHDRFAAVSIYIISVAIGCSSNVGFTINHMDLTSNYAGILMGLSNTFAATGASSTPLVVSCLVHDVTSVTEWRLVFYLGAAILFFGNAFFVIFGSGETQSWNNKLRNAS